MCPLLDPITNNFLSSFHIQISKPLLEITILVFFSRFYTFRTLSYLCMSNENSLPIAYGENIYLINATFFANG